VTTDNAHQDALATDEVLVYVGDQATEVDQTDLYEQPARIIRRRVREHGLEVVKIDDAELDRLRNQVRRIASKLEPADGVQQDKGFGVDSITLHIGLSVSGHFFLVASAEVEAAIDITWSIRK
jgi:hypothetical protein